MPHVSHVTLYLVAAIVAALTGIFLILRGPRIISLLIFKYLRRRRIAWVSLAAVMLCTTMVLVVISVMGGWLRMFEQSFHGLSGDIIVSGQRLTGFAHYERMIGLKARVRGEGHAFTAPIKAVEGQQVTFDVEGQGDVTLTVGSFQGNLAEFPDRHR